MIFHGLFQLVFDLRLAHKSNWDYLQANSDIINPNKVRVPKNYWVTLILLRDVSFETTNLVLGKLFKIGFNRVLLLNSGKLLVFTNKTDKSVVEYYLAAYG